MMTFVKSRACRFCATVGVYRYRFLDHFRPNGEPVYVRRYFCEVCGEHD